MRVAYLTCVYPPYPGGIGMAAAGMAREMSKRGYEVHVFTPQYKQGLAAQRQCENLAVHYLKPCFCYGNAALLPQITRLLKDFEIIHLLYPFFGAAELLPILRHRTKAKIIVHHTMDAVADGWLGLTFSLYNKTLMPWIFKQAHTMITLSEDYFRECDITNVYANFPDAPPIEFVPNGVDVDLFRPNYELRTNREHTKLINCSYVRTNSSVRSNGVPIILFASGLDRAHYFKGVHVLIEAMRLLKERGVKCCCKIIGDGNMRGEYEKHARELGLMKTEDRRQKTDFRPPSSVLRPPWETYIEFLGLIPHDEMPQYYQQATAAVVPSTERVECFSIVAAEAQSCGIPAIVSDFPGVRVTVEHGVTGYVIRPGDPEDLAKRIQELVDHPEQARAMGQKGRQRAIQFYSWQKIGDKLENIYKRLL